MNKAIYSERLIIRILIFGFFTIHFSDLSCQTSLEKIQQLIIQTDSFKNYIEDLKIEIINNYPSTYETPDTLNNFFFKEKKATYVKELIELYKIFIITNFSDIIKPKELDDLMPTKIRNRKQFSSWEDEYFGHIPHAAAIAILSALQTNAIYIKETIIERIK